MYTGRGHTCGTSCICGVKGQLVVGGHCNPWLCTCTMHTEPDLHHCKGTLATSVRRLASTLIACNCMIRNPTL
jgi:hypothetical protein